MLFACVAISIAVIVYLVRDPEQAWRMVFSWWRKIAPDDESISTSTQDTDGANTEAVNTAVAIDAVVTPKAYAQTHDASVPTLDINDTMGDSDEDEDNLPPPQFPALNSAQRASNESRNPASAAVMQHPIDMARGASLMPPPPRPASAGLRPPASASLRVPPSASSNNGLRIPSSGPLPNRGPPQAATSLKVHLATSVAQPNPRKKIALAPGHSPLDWANLQRTHPNLAGVNGFQRITPSVLKSFNGRKGRPAWASYQGKVYNITPYLPFHPGGEGELRRCAGKDGEKLFMDVHPWVNWDNMLEQCLVGILVSENDPHIAQESPLDAMD